MAICTKVWQIGGFCMGVKLAWGGYVTNIVTTSSLNRASRRREDGAGNLKGSFGVLRSPWVCHIKPDLCQKEEISVFVYQVRWPLVKLRRG